MIMFCNRVICNWQEPYVCLFIVCNAIALQCFTLSLSRSDSRRSIKLVRRQRCYDGDQGVAPVTMVIMMVLRRWRSQAQDDDGHIISLILIACDFYLLCILSCFD